MAVCSENNYCTKEMFVPCLTIYPSEWKRRIYLDNFLECMFDPNVLEEYNEKTEYAGIYITNLFEQVYFKIFNYTYIIDYVCKWLASSTGQQYLTKCKIDVQKEIEIRAQYEFKRNY